MVAAGGAECGCPGNPPACVAWGGGACGGSMTVVAGAMTGPTPGDATVGVGDNIAIGTCSLWTS